MIPFIETTGQICHIGLSTETKPQPRNGDSFLELDTGKMWQADGAAWSCTSNNTYSGTGHNHSGVYEAAGAVASHAAAADPHAGYQKESEKGQASGYAGLDIAGLVPVAQLPGLPAAWGAITGVLSAQTDLQAALDAKQAALGFTPENVANKAQANGYASLGGDGKVPAAQLPASGSFVVAAYEANLGATPAWQGKFTLTDASITPSSKILISQASGPYTGKGTRADEAEMDRIECYAEPGSGQATVKWRSASHVAQQELAPESGRVGVSAVTRLQTRAVVVGRVKGNVKFNYVIG